MNSSSSTAFSLSATFLSSDLMTFSTAMEPLRSNWNATEPEVPSEPPEWEKAERTSAAVRFLLSVRQST